MKCNKCSGTGLIQGFSHVQGGKCFKCNGRGLVADPKPGSFTAAQIFINQYTGAGFFPSDCTAETVKVLSFEGHPTAEQRLMTDGEFMYIGQPVCRSSTWWMIPLSAYSEFKVHYEKAYKQTL